MSPWLMVVMLPIAIFALWLWRRRKAPAIRRREVPKPPHLAALEALDELRAEPAADEADMADFHLRLAAVLRRYLADGFALPAPLRTTEELLLDAALAKGPLRGRRHLIEQPLGQCDLVKFARHRPSGEAMGRALDDAAAFIRQTSGVDRDRAGQPDAD
jgi:hypothetical protein